MWIANKIKINNARWEKENSDVEYSYLLRAITHIVYLHSDCLVIYNIFNISLKT